MDEKHAIELLTSGAHCAETVLLGPGDDTAVLQPPGDKVLTWTTDVQEEGRHFRRRWLQNEQLARRVLAVNLSDLAAMGARPWAYLLAVGVPSDTDENDLRELATGLRHAEEEWGLTLAGGHTWRHDPGWLFVISMAGIVPEGNALRRDTASAGMGLYVSGTLGGSARGLEILRAGRGGARNEAEMNAVNEWIRPEPRIALGIALRQRHLEAALIDISDGLSTDLHHLCQASGVGARIEIDRLPFDPSLEGLDASHRLHLALHGGEDYELLFATSRGASLKSLNFHEGITRIGEIRPESEGVRLAHPDGSENDLPAAGHDHFLTP
jgi:thiamine-monophosphate kinase